jgi:hypothetical protein
MLLGTPSRPFHTATTYAEKRGLCAPTSETQEFGNRAESISRLPSRMRYAGLQIVLSRGALLIFRTAIGHAVVKPSQTLGTFLDDLLANNSITDMREHFVIDPLISKRQQLLLATQLCRMVLKVRNRNIPHTV